MNLLLTFLFVSVILGLRANRVDGRMQVLIGSLATIVTLLYLYVRRFM